MTVFLLPESTEQREELDPEMEQWVFHYERAQRILETILLTHPLCQTVLEEFVDLQLILPEQAKQYNNAIPNYVKILILGKKELEIEKHLPDSITKRCINFDGKYTDIFMTGSELNDQCPKNITDKKLNRMAKDLFQERPWRTPYSEWYEFPTGCTDTRIIKNIYNAGFWLGLDEQQCNNIASYFGGKVKKNEKRVVEEDWFKKGERLKSIEAGINEILQWLCYVPEFMDFDLKIAFKYLSRRANAKGLRFTSDSDVDREMDNLLERRHDSVLAYRELEDAMNYTR